MVMTWAYYDDVGEVVRFIDYPAVGAEPYPPPHPSLALDDPEWDNPLF
jgi:hypothetical protein